MTTAPHEQERVLSTLNADGSRRWLDPRLSKGRWLNRRRLVGYALIAIFVTMPHLRINGKPPLLLDIMTREFTFFGTTLHSTDAFLLAPLLIAIFLSVFFLTALFGRIWCGWACPQTVYLELVYRPVERFFKRLGKKKLGGAAGGLRFIVYVLISFILANTFLSYFVGTDRLHEWVFGSPFDHPVAFLIVMGVTAAMLFDFGYFREQTCIVACPYGRFQSVMLDRDSLIIGYDRRRGEPREKLSRKRKAQPGEDISLKVVAETGDCIDCQMCVTTCPTGIDIRDGLQLECVSCAQCIDACDTVMDKIGKPRGLIRYASQRSLEDGSHRFLRPRVIVYPVVVAVLLTLLTIGLSGRGPVLARVIRGPGAPFTILDGGYVTNSVKVKLHDRSGEASSYTLTLLGAEGASILGLENPMTLDANQMRTEPVLFSVPLSAFRAGGLDVRLRLEGGGGFLQEIPYRMLGPTGPAAATPTTTPATPSADKKMGAGDDE